ncbi:MAG TPA: hypothetical protein VNJ01_06200 [Bacteriovoracaceae bacterium]|nr:hypothetical protein [Bacteriovoracaceae bacterium]
MKILALIILAAAISGCQTYNSNTEDEAKYGPTNLVGGAEFIRAYPVIQSRCISCHNYHDEWANYTDSNDWVVNNLVVAGAPNSSLFITRIINHGGSGANMPQGQGPLPDAEYDLLVDWVTNGL